MTTRHDRLFARYVKDLRKAKDAADEWWEELLQAELAKTDERNRALEAVRRRWPIGPAAHPYVIAVVRKYFLACDTLNDELADAEGRGEEVYPHVFVSEWLLDDETEDLADFVSVLTYWPIGFDSEGDFI